MEPGFPQLGVRFPIKGVSAFMCSTVLSPVDFTVFLMWADVSLWGGAAPLAPFLHDL